MTPAARAQAIIAVLDRVAAGEASEKALTNWARGARYAGSKDRAAVRDGVFDVVRTWRSTAALGGGDSGRARLLGHLRAQGADPEPVFDGSRYGPEALTRAEREAGRAPTAEEALDLPDWLIAAFRDSLGEEADPVARVLRGRAGVFLRVNSARTDPAGAVAALAAEGIVAVPQDASPTALLVQSGARGIQRSAAYRDGLVELQDAQSQAVVDAVPLERGASLLDFCAGGGGKTLAMAARGPGRILAHDADPRRMRDLPARAARAGADIELAERPEGLFDLVLCDVPCSGSGAWRRAPDGKWRLTPEGLSRLAGIQDAILDRARTHVAPGGSLAYVTCSVLAVENTGRIAAFRQRHGAWREARQHIFLPSAAGDGFFLSLLERA